MSRTYEAKASEGLAQLGLGTALELLDSTAQKAAASKWSYSHFLGYLLDAELQGKHERQVLMSTRCAHFPYLKNLEDFDFKAQPSIDPRLIDELATLRFLGEGRNVVLLGPPGVGKTHLAIALALQAIKAGNRAYFINAMDMARKLAEATERNQLPRLIKNMTKIRLLVLDEVGYLELSKNKPASSSRSSPCDTRPSCPSSSLPTRPSAIGPLSSPVTMSWPPPPSTGSCTNPRSSPSAEIPTGSRKSASPASPPPSTPNLTQPPIHDPNSPWVGHF